MIHLALAVLSAPVGIQRTDHGVSLDNKLVRLEIDTVTGEYGLSWGQSAGIPSASAAFKDEYGNLLKSSSYATHTIGSGDVQAIRDAFGSGYLVTCHNQSPTLPELRQRFWIYKGKPEVFLRVDVVFPSLSKTNRIEPLHADSPFQVRHGSPLHSLFVPWDNDSYFRYSSDGWVGGPGGEDGSYELGAVYDDESRNGLVAGSIEHDRWKSAVSFSRDSQGSPEGFHLAAGVAGKFTHDWAPHGFVEGQIVSSPKFVVSWYSDWRRGLERYGDLNAVVQPPLPWTGGKPFFWNSWSGHKSNVQFKDATYATDFVAQKLPGFRSGHTAYLNLDAGGGNLGVQIQTFITHAHALGLRVGTYWTPFVCWYPLDQKVGRGNVTFRDLVLKDVAGQPLPKLDGGYPYDPTNPIVLDLIDENAAHLVKEGFDYVKMDFLSHGALEGQHHNPKVTTGTAAFALGMKRIAEDLSPSKIGRPFFLSESIAPLFPQGFAHSRRISCDVFANIGASEYLMNSANYAWWEAGRLYPFNDPDSATVYQALGEQSTTDAEANTRFLSSVVAGGMMILGDNLANPPAAERVLALFGNDEALEVARRHSPFEPVEGDTASNAGHLFERRDGKTLYVAAFNFSKDEPFDRSLTLKTLGVIDGTWTVWDVQTKKQSQITHQLDLHLAPMSSTLLKLTKR